MKILFYRILVFSLFGAVVGASLFYVAPQIFVKEKTAFAQESRGGYSVVKGVMFYQENLVYADRRGEVEKIALPDKRIARGEIGVKIKSAVTDLTADDVNVVVGSSQSGLLFYKTDGLETILTPNNIGDISVGEIIEQKENYPPQGTGEFCQKGDVVFKTIDNFRQPYLGICCPQGFFKATPKIGDEIKCIIEAQETVGKIVFVGIKDEGLDLIFQLNACDIWFNKRFVNVSLLGGTYSESHKFTLKI